MAIIPPCDECTDRRAETVIVDVSRPGAPVPRLCFDCLRGHPEFRIFKILSGCRKPPKDLTARRVEEAQALRDQGLTYYAIGDRFSVGHVTVQGWLKPELAARYRVYGRNWYANSEKAQLKRDRDRAYKAEHPLYSTWFAMRYRCYTPSSENYADYGGRGIGMHPTWENNFDAFETWLYANLGQRPKGTSLDRIDNDGNYEPGNVRWATRKVQQNNKRQPVKNATTAKLRAQLIAAGLEPCA
jgi:hypothetical protein